MKLTPYYDKDGITIYCGDCLEIMPLLGLTFDAILVDLPYGTTNCKWDSIIPLNDYIIINGKVLTHDEYFLWCYHNGYQLHEAHSTWESVYSLGLWAYYKRLIKINGAIALTCSQPFTTTLANSNTGWLKYEWIWKKNRGSNFVSVKYQPFKEHESVLVFYQEKPTYNPQMIKVAESSLKRDKVGAKRKMRIVNGDPYTETYGIKKHDRIIESTGYKHPSSVIAFNVPMGKESVKHPTQKPLGLMQHLVKTYTDPGDLILDNTAGSFTTGVACLNNGRRFVGIEKSEEYCKIAVGRLSQRSLFSIPSPNPPSPKFEQGSLIDDKGSC